MRSERFLRNVWLSVSWSLLVISGFSIIYNCAALIEAQKPFSEMTTKEKTVYIMSMYNKQYDEYLSLYQKGNHSAEEKEVLRVKYDLLKELNPYIGLYVTYSETGEVPNEVIEKKLIDLINKSIQN